MFSLKCDPIPGTEPSNSQEASGSGQPSCPVLLKVTGSVMISYVETLLSEATDYQQSFIVDLRIV